MKKFRGIFVTVVIFLLLFSTMAYGVTWSTKKRITNNAGDSVFPAIAADSSNIYVVWWDLTLGVPYVYFKKSDDGGLNWTSGKRLTINAFSLYPAIAVDGSNIYVVWYAETTPGHFDIYFKKSEDGGVTWTDEERLTNDAGDSLYPDIAVDGSNVYVVWEDSSPGNIEIYFKKSGDGGATWTADKRLTDNAGYSSSPTIVVDGSNVYAVWADDTPGNSEIYFKKSDDGGVTWTADKRLTDNTGDSYEPDIIIVSGSNVYVVWADNRLWTSEIYFKKSGDGGATWTADKRLTDNAGYSSSPTIVADGSNVYVVWEDSLPGNVEIYFKESIDGGVTWPTRKRITYSGGYSANPAIAIVGPNIYVVWQDDRGGDSEIFFKKGLRP